MWPHLVILFVFSPGITESWLILPHSLCDRSEGGFEPGTLWSKVEWSNNSAISTTSNFEGYYQYQYCGGISTELRRNIYVKDNFVEKVCAAWSETSWRGGFPTPAWDISLKAVTWFYVFPKIKLNKVVFSFLPVDCHEKCYICLSKRKKTPFMPRLTSWSARFPVYFQCYTR